MASLVTVETQTFFEYIGFKGKKLPNGYWQNKKNHKIYCEYLFKKLGYTTMDDWYKLIANNFKRNRGEYLLKQYNWSPIKVLSSVYPDYEWFWWKFKSVSRNKWNDITNIREYMDWLGNMLGYTIIEDWYKISRRAILQNYGARLIDKYGCIIKILKAVYPNYQWFPWKFNKMGNGEWEDPEIQKLYIEWLGEKVLGYTTREDWYKITSYDIMNNYGKGLIHHHMSEGIYGLIKTVYPNYQWYPWKFNKISNGGWIVFENQKWYIEWLGEVLGYTTMEDWYKISRRAIVQNYGSGLLSVIPSYISILTKVYPEYNWNKSKFINNKTEKILNDYLIKNKCVLGIKMIVYQYKKDWCINLDTGRHLPYDFYIELANGKKIIIECDGVQHYTEHSHFHRNDWTLEKQQDRDRYKMNNALENDVSIIRILQEEVWNDTIDWKKELTDAINEIKNENEVTIKLLGSLKDKVPWDIVDSE